MRWDLISSFHSEEATNAPLICRFFLELLNRFGKVIDLVVYRFPASAGLKVDEHSSWRPNWQCPALEVKSSKISSAEASSSLFKSKPMSEVFDGYGVCGYFG